MNQRILITGSCGLIGAALTPALQERGAELRLLDLIAEGNERGDIRHADSLRAALKGCDGVIHLAAISRVAWGEQQPDLCWATNVEGLRNLIEAAASSVRKPWLLFASSREVYGQPDRFPVDESFPFSPRNVYGRSKAKGELLLEAARREGFRVGTLRLSNVYGSTHDHADRVVPAFIQAALRGEDIRLDGADRVFDFTHVGDVVQGFLTLTDLLTEESPPPIHLVSGVPTTLQDLAEMILFAASSASEVRLASPRAYDVVRFVGNGERAKRLLGWKPLISLEKGILQLVDAYKNRGNFLNAQKDFR